MSDSSGKMSVSGLVNLLQEVVETNFVVATVEGEVSNFASPASGHWYFTLKDRNAQLRMVMFRGQNRLLRFNLEDGDQIVCSGSVTVYSARGDLQMVVENLAPVGQGALQKAFDELKQQLDAEGLFAESRKKAIPAFPQSVGVVTSATGAALQDVLQVMRRRAPNVRLVFRPVTVQGDTASSEISEAISDFNHFGMVDVLIVGRGGGSIEDLWAFNEEAVVRAIAESDLPVISAVGHETDFTISDFVADLRAPTPSAAAELVAKNHRDVESHLDHLVIRLKSQIEQTMGLVSEKLNGLERRLQLYSREFNRLPANIDVLDERLQKAINEVTRHYEDRLRHAAGQLNTLSPLSQLERGFAIVSKERDSAGLVNAKELSRGDTIWLRLSNGRATASVEDVEN